MTFWNSTLTSSRTVLISTAALTLCACGSSETLSPNALISTAQGTVQGVTTKNPEIFNFKGIPYAQAPVGKARWAAPQPAPKWDTTFTANEFGNRCMQPSGTENGFLSRLIEGHGLGWFKTFLINRVTAAQKPAPMSEDCLFLNVRTGNLKGQDKHPVMVWIHGGAHQFGSGSLNYYQSNGLVEKDVVLVTINYRLGVMGYMAHPALSENDPNGVSGNYGTLDQIAALKWVKDNISAYGGDPNNVTIFGESAGGWSVTELMASPLAKNLFHKAIGQSGASTYHLGQMEGDGLGWPSGYDGGAQVEKALGLTNPSADELRAIPAQDVQNVITEKMSDAFHHIRDGYVFPDNVGLSFAKGVHNKVPTLFGYNADEGTLFFSGDPQPTVWLPDVKAGDRDELSLQLEKAFPAQANKIVDLYNLDKDFEAGGTQMMGDEIFGVNVRFVTQQNEAQGQDSYLYHFSRIAPSKNQTLGAFHAAEIPFVFASYETILGYSDEDEKLTELLTSYWTNFAKTGNPNGNDLPNWPQYNGQNWLHFSGNTGQKITQLSEIRKTKLDALEEGLIFKLESLETIQAPQNSPEIVASDSQSNE